MGVTSHHCQLRLSDQLRAQSLGKLSNPNALRKSSAYDALTIPPFRGAAFFVHNPQQHSSNLFCLTLLIILLYSVTLRSVALHLPWYRTVLGLTTPFDSLDEHPWLPLTSLCNTLLSPLARRALRRLFSSLPLEILFHVVRYFSLRELLLLSTSKKFNHIATRELRDRVTDLFLMWHLNANAMFQLMDDLAVVMSGSAALYIASPGPWWPQDLDFYCPAGRYQQVVDFFETQGYVVYQPPPPDDTTPNSTNDLESAFYKVLGCIRRVGFLSHPVHGHKLNLIESVVLSPEAPIFLFHSTAVMNVVSSGGVRCFYPEWTFAGQTLVNYISGRPDWMKRRDKELEVLHKYALRGFTVHEDCASLHGRRRSCHICSRRFRHSDEGTMGMNFTADQSTVIEPHCHWMLGAHTSPKASAISSRVVLVVDGDHGDAVYDGRCGHVEFLGKSRVKHMFRDYGF